MKDFMQLIFPSRCSGCGSYDADALCGLCKKKILSEPAVLFQTPEIEKGLSLGHYRDVLRNAVLDFKFKHKRILGKPLGELLAVKLQSATWKIDLIVPIPMSPNRRSERGYNPPRVLADHLAAVLGAECGNFLSVCRPLAHQLSLGKRERRQNIRGAFKVANHEKIANKSVLLLDDVITTGSTLSEAALAVKQGNPLKVVAATIAFEEKKSA